VVDRNDEVWVAHSLGRDTVGHILNNGTFVENIVVGVGPTGVSVDGNGKIWSSNYNDDSTSRIDPTFPGGSSVDLTLDLGTDANPCKLCDE
jgi:streptogramin lyase